MTNQEAVDILEEVKYNDDSMYAYNDAYCEALDMAIEALKAQEPRLMTLEEARNSLMIEYRSGNTRDVGAKLFGNFAEWHNKVWRVWTSRPTDEQREATPWN